MTRHADLVALATIADVVPLLDENRSLAIAGLRALARTQKPGLRALMRSASVDPARSIFAVGFRLAPRINAAGRLGRPDVALELLLTEDEDEATRLANELETLNRDRQAVEDRILRSAVAQIEAWPESRRRRRGYVLWDEDWHEGVIGIVASRLVERFNRPVVMITGTAEGDWKGSGRSVSSFDLHGALAASSVHLRRFGGHRAAAGLSIDPGQLEGFAQAFAAHADLALTDVDLVPTTRIDAVVAGRELTLPLATELQRLAPFGLGNPDVTLLVPSCEPVAPALVGDGKHLRFRVRQRDRDAGSAIGFGLGGQLDRLRRPVRYDVACRLKENHWNGTVAPQLVIRRLFDAPDGYEELWRRFAEEWRAGEDAWSDDARAVFARARAGGGRKAAAVRVRGIPGPARRRAHARGGCLDQRPHDPRGHAERDDVGRQVARDDRTRADDRVLADRRRPGRR